MTAKSVPLSELKSAAEIVAMKIPGLPTSKGKLIVRATAEGWYYEEASGRGGMRRLYAIPEKYISGVARAEAIREAEERIARGRQVAGSLPEMDLIQQVVRGVENWIKNNNLSIDSDKKAVLVSLLVSYFKERGNVDGRALDEMLRAVA